MLINIDIPGSSYHVRIGDNLETFGSYLKELSGACRVIVVTNDLVGPLYRDRLSAALARAGFSFEFIEIPDGEKYKSIETAVSIYDELSRKKMERLTPLVGFGGGVVGDVAGFAASTYMRGLPFYNIPTSLIAQVDSSVGGKTGVNLSWGKNLIGTFYQPRYVHVDIDLLKTLDDREYRSGLAEVVKHAVLKGNEFFEYLEKNSAAILEKDPDILEVVVTECVRIKGDVVVKDEREAGLRKILNLGHTIGHGLEAEAGYGSMRHGEGISLGMIAAFRLAESAAGLPQELTCRLKDLLFSFGLPVRIPQSSVTEKIIELMYMDKKVRQGRIEFVLPVGLGEVRSGIAVTDDAIREVIEEFRE